MEEIIAKLKTIIESISEVDDLKDQDLLKDKGISSLKLLLILNEIEKTFNLEIPDDELIMTNFDSMASIAKLIRKIK